MKEGVSGYHENLNNKVNKKILFLCEKVLKTPTLKRVMGLGIGGSCIQEKRQRGQNPEQDDIDIDVDVFFTLLPNNRDMSKICKQILGVFQEGGYTLDIRYLIDVFGNHAVLNEKTPGCVPVEIAHDFSREDIKKIYTEKHPRSTFIVRNKVWAKLFFLT